MRGSGPGWRASFLTAGGSDLLARFGGYEGHRWSKVGKENAGALRRCRALPTFVVWRAFALVGRPFLDGRKVSKEIAATGPRCRFEPTWCVASRRADSRGRIGGAPRGARTMIGGRAVGPRRRRSRPRSSFRQLHPEGSSCLPAGPGWVARRGVRRSRLPGRGRRRRERRRAGRSGPPHPPTWRPRRPRLLLLLGAFRSSATACLANLAAS
jgi:hypothetical protein